MEMINVLKEAIEKGASDVFVIAGLPLTFKINGSQLRMGEPIMPGDIRKIVEEIYDLSLRSKEVLDGGIVDDDFSFSIPKTGRFRANVLKQRGTLAMVLRIIGFDMPDPVELKIPDEVMAFAEKRKGLVLVTGPAGAGKSTTLACLINKINSTREGHIITMEDPIEYVHSHKNCIVTQREIGVDAESYISALRSALRESPDVILLGEMRDYETIETAMTAAETGELLFSTLHTTGAACAIDRIIDVFPASQQNQVRIQLSLVLEGVVSQQLVPTVGGGQTVAFEVMTITPAIRNLIREGKTHQIDSIIQTGSANGMFTMDQSLLKLHEKGIISCETAMAYSLHQEAMKNRLKGV